MVNFIQNREELMHRIVEAFLMQHPENELAQEAERVNLLTSMSLAARYAHAEALVKKSLPAHTDVRPVLINPFQLEAIALRAMMLTDGHVTPELAQKAIELEIVNA